MLAKKTAKNQITLPKEVVKIFPGINYFDVRLKDNKILLTPVKITPISGTLESIRSKMKKLGITEKDVADAIKWARARKA